jgi:hypothetical protein
MAGIDRHDHGRVAAFFTMPDAAMSGRDHLGYAGDPDLHDERARRSARPPKNPVASGRHRMSD